MIKQPGTQILLTNVVVVRLKHKGKRYELACYPNKVNAWKEGLEHDIGEVLQVQDVFTNVSKGKAVRRKQLLLDFEHLANFESIIKHILENGEVQISELERQAQQEALLRDIANHISKISLCEATGTPLPPGLILQGMKDSHYNVKQNKSAKHQALIAYKHIKDSLGLVRAKMRLKLTAPQEQRTALLELLGEVTCESDQQDRALWTAVFLIDPEVYRRVTEQITASGWAATVNTELLDRAVLQGPKVEEAKKVVIEERKAVEVRTGLQCSSCPGAEFTDKSDHRNHFKSVWHKVNLKRKLRSLDALNEREFSILSPSEVEAFLAFKSS
jgi:ribosome maturation protein SDO1